MIRVSRERQIRIAGDYLYGDHRLIYREAGLVKLLSFRW